MGASAGAGDGSRPPGLREQLGRTLGAVRHLLGAHVDLAKAELGDILDEVKRIALLAGLAAGVLLLLGLLVPIGLTLFLGEWLFGSMGWGILHGALLLVAIAVACVLLALRVERGRLLRALLLGVVVGAVVAVVLGLDLTNRAWTALGDQVAGNLPADVRPLAVAAASLAALGALLGLLLGGRGGVGGALGGMLAGALAGALLGALTALALGPQVGVAVGVTVGLTTWLATMTADAVGRGIDVEKLKARLMPRETMDTARETIEWVRAQTPLGPKS